MDVQLCSLLDHHHSFGFMDIFEQSLNSDTVVSSTSLSQCHSPDTSDSPSSSIPNFISDTGTPGTSTASLITFIQPGTFVFPPQTSDPVPFPSADWFPFSTPMTNPYLNPSHFQALPTWDGNHTPLPIGMSGGNYGVADTPFILQTFHLGCEGTGNLDPLFYGPSYQSDEGGFGIDQIPQTNDAATAGPKRVERSRKRLAPYKVDNDHEGAKKKKLMSQQGFLSESPGYEDFGHEVNVPKRLTKRQNKKKSRPSLAVQPVADPSAPVDRSLVGASGQEQRGNTPTPPPIVKAPTATSVPLDRKRIAIKTIRRHARLKKKDSEVVFINYEDLQKWN